MIIIKRLPLAKEWWIDSFISIQRLSLSLNDYKTIHSVFDGNYPYSFNVLFIRVW